MPQVKYFVINAKVNLVKYLQSKVQRQSCLFYFCCMAGNFMAQINVGGKANVAAILPQIRKNGIFYEVNLKGFPRFYMHWSPLGRYDIDANEGITIPYEVLLAVSDAIEKKVSK